MPSYVRWSLSELRRLIAWCLATEERIADLVFLVGPLLIVAAALFVWSLNDSLAVSLTQLNILRLLLLLTVVGWLCTLAVFQQRGWLKLTGPLLWYDLICISRRPRYIILRFLYAILLAALLCWIHLLWDLDGRQGQMNSREMANFAEYFFYTFLVVQLFVMVVLTPAYTAGAIAEEKDRKTLEFVLVTDLRNREIVLSKFFSRLANLSMLILTGLPILSFLQFMGGVDPNLVFAGFAATALLVVSLASLSMLNSVLTKRPRDAIALTYLGGIAYLLLSGASWLLLITPWKLASFPSTSTWQSPITLEDCVYGINAGNPISAAYVVGASVSRGGRLSQSLEDMLGKYAIFHGIITLLSLSWAVARLRAIALKQSYGQTQKASRRFRILRRPRLGTRPMLWKELFVESGLRMNVLAKILVFLLVVGSFVPVGFFIADYLEHGTRPWGSLARDINVWVRSLGTVVACLMLLAVGSRSASSVSHERDRQTIDALLTTPLDSNTILFAKWIGNIFSVRWGWLWLGLIYMLGLVSGGLDPLALLLLLFAWFVYAGVVSLLGLWFSIVSRTSLRATIWTFLATAGAGVGHWLLWVCCIPLMISMRSEPEMLKWIRNVQIGITPPAALSYAFAFYERDFAGNYSGLKDQWEAVGFALLGLFFWTAVAGFLWGAASARFRVLTGRQPLTRPEARLKEQGDMRT